MENCRHAKPGRFVINLWFGLHYKFKFFEIPDKSVKFLGIPGISQRVISIAYPKSN